MDDTDYALGRTTAEDERVIAQAALLCTLAERLFAPRGSGPARPGSFSYLAPPREMRTL